MAPCSHAATWTNSDFRLSKALAAPGRVVREIANDLSPQEDASGHFDAAVGGVIFGA